MEHNRLLVLFGPPGVGKSYVAEVLARRYGFYFCDFDKDLTPEYEAAVAQGGVVPEEIRANQRRYNYERLQTLIVSHHKVVYAQALFRERLRVEFLELFPWAEFVLVDTPRELRVERLEQRTGHPSPLENAMWLGDMFEPVGIPHRVLRNDLSKDDLLTALAKIVDE